MQDSPDHEEGEWDDEMGDGSKKTPNPFGTGNSEVSKGTPFTEGKNSCATGSKRRAAPDLPTREESKASTIANS